MLCWIFLLPESYFSKYRVVSRKLMDLPIFVLSNLMPYGKVSELRLLINWLNCRSVPLQIPSIYIYIYISIYLRQNFMRFHIGILPLKTMNINQ